MGEFMRQQVALWRAIVPIDEIARLYAIFGTAMMLQPDPAKLVGDRQQEMVIVIMLCAEQLDRLFDQRLVRLNLFGLGGELGGAVGNDIQRHPRGQRE